MPQDYRGERLILIYIALFSTLLAFVYFGVQGDLGISFAFQTSPLYIGFIYSAHKPTSIAK